MGRHRQGAQAARQRAEPIHRRRLPRAADPRRQRRAARTDREVEGLPSGMHGRQSGARRVVARVRHRFSARRRRHRLRSRRQPARAVRRVVHAREPRGHEARVPRVVRGLPDPADRRLRRPAVANAALVVAAQNQEPRGGGADARHLQLGVFRTRVPGASDGVRAGRGFRTSSSAKTTACTCAPSKG